jgi:D-alanyl-D-alanine dipeptidase
MKTAVKECFVRREVYEMLKNAQENLPDGYRLRIWDTWRPLSLQKELYEVYRQSIIDTFNLSSLSQSEQNEFISKYIAIPSENPDSPPAHTTGGAVDLTLIDVDGNELDMGTAFDDFSEKAETDYFEKHGFDGSVVRKNRRILKSAMESAGFTNLPSEWWHYDYGNRNWALYSKSVAVYKGVFEKEHLIFE